MLADLRQSALIVKFLFFNPLYEASCSKGDFEIAWRVKPTDGRRITESGAFYVLLLFRLPENG